MNSEEFNEMAESHPWEYRKYLGHYTLRRPRGSTPETKWDSTPLTEAPPEGFPVYDSHQHKLVPYVPQKPYQWRFSENKRRSSGEISGPSFPQAMV